MIDCEDNYLTINHQCDLLGLARSSLYYQPCCEGKRELAIMKTIDEIYTKNPEYGNRRIRFEVNRLGNYNVGRDHIRSLMH